jgi:hypothetical protein
MGGQAHGAVKGALGHGEPAIGVQADQEQLAGLVGGEGEREALLGQPGRELARGQKLQRRPAGSRRRRFRQRGSRR